MTEKSKMSTKSIQDSIQDMADRCITPEDGVTTVGFYCMAIGLTPEGIEFVDKLEEDDSVPVSQLHEFLRFSRGNCGNESLNELLLENIVRSILAGNQGIRQQISAEILQEALEFLKANPEELEQEPSNVVH